LLAIWIACDWIRYSSLKKHAGQNCIAGPPNSFWKTVRGAEIREPLPNGPLRNRLKKLGIASLISKIAFCALALTNALQHVKR
jgi:hypothetical protein